MAVDRWYASDPLWCVYAGPIGKRDHHPDTRDRISRRRIGSFRGKARAKRSSWQNSSRSVLRTRSIGSVIASGLGLSPTSSRTRASNECLVTWPIRYPKTFRDPLTEFSMSCCASSLLTKTCRNQPSRTRCAIPRASLRSVLLRTAHKPALRCRHSSQIAGNLPNAARYPVAWGVLGSELARHASAARCDPSKSPSTACGPKASR